MKNKIITSIGILILFIPSWIFSQSGKTDTLKCNVNIVTSTFQELNDLSQGRMIEFFKTFGGECENNAEYQEYSNEVLFKVLQTDPELFISSIDLEKNEIDLDDIISNLENPLFDLIDLEKTLIVIESTQCDTNLKSQITNAIQIAIEKY
jgi:hypothetical protein